MAPYTWIFGINMMIRVGLAGWSAWIVYVLVGTMQIVLIVTAIIFAVRDRKSGNESKHPSEDPSFNGWNTTLRPRQGSGTSHAPSNISPDERSPLITNGKQSSRQH
ncbi:hypothetical protein LTR64_003878 [Lithohypha guttulata]|uniref:Uncharacterized protein n=1 Tax=Lithohypha guttulata TaxID=1690604 RepID=A0AAN7T5G5_9EURO|nr:hypothetical protein LTR51_006916 [Lithohypha guttulata]KAK5089043.1 hypothetical protein LTR05_003267 [Lithohypha guttulata]